MVIRIKTEEIENAADDLQAVRKRLLHSLADLISIEGRMRNAGLGMSSECVELRRQQNILESDLAKLDVMAGVLKRTAGEMSDAEESVLDSDIRYDSESMDVSVCDLNGIADMVDEVMGDHE